MTYKTKCNGHCTNQIDAQVETIKALRESNVTKTKALIEASKQIAQLRAEKADLTDVLNKVSRPVNMRADQNWDSSKREESWEL